MGTTVTSKGQVTIPKKIRDFLGVKRGASVEFKVGADGRVTVSRAGKARAVSRLAGLRGIAKGGLSTDEIMALTRGDD
jgi:antitoxin PrlF